MRKTLGVLAAICALGSTGAKAAFVIYTPISIDATTVDGNQPAYEVSNLVNTAITESDIGTTNNLGAQYASYGWLPGPAGPTYGSPAVIMDFGSSLTFNSMIYSQRANGTDNIARIDLWFSDTPFTLVPNVPDDGYYQTTPNPGTPANQSIIITEASQIITNYSFTGAESGRYVFARLYVPEGWTIGSSNPGGSALLLAAVPEPSTVGLMMAASLGLVAYGVRSKSRRKAG